MRILMLGWEFPPFISGGLGTACFGITSGLTELGQDIIFVLPKIKGERTASHVELVSAADTPIRHLAGPQEARFKEIVQTETTPPKIKIAHIDSPLRPYLSTDQYVGVLYQYLPGEPVPPGVFGAGSTEDRILLTGDYSLNLIDEVIRYALLTGELAQHHSFDIIHAHDWMTVFAGVSARQVSGKPLVLHVHSLEFDRSGENINQAIYNIERYGMEEADHLIAVSHYTKNRIIHYYGIHDEKITVVHNAVTHQEARQVYRTKKTSDYKMVPFLGRITFQKGPDYFVEAAARVLDILPKVKFVMAGTGDMMTRMIERVAELGIGRSFHFTGFLQGEEVEKIFSLTDLYVMPSVSEPFGISPLEAMSYDVPVIISHQSGVSELIKHALKVNFWDVDDIADRIIALLRHPVLSEEITYAAREELKKIHWTAAAEKINRVYQALMKEP